MSTSRAAHWIRATRYHSPHLPVYVQHVALIGSGWNVIEDFNAVRNVLRAVGLPETFGYCSLCIRRPPSALARLTAIIRRWPLLFHVRRVLR